MEEQVRRALGSVLEMDRSEMEGMFLTFWTDGQLFGVPIADVVQIVGMQKITQVPDYPPYAKGIINLRGAITPLIDIRLRLGREETGYGDRTCIIVANVRGRDFGFIVDEVDEVTGIDEEMISEPPKMAGDGGNSYLTGVARLQQDGAKEEKIALLLDVTRILGDNEFEALAQAAG